MSKILVKESELREIIREAVTEELEVALNEGLGTALGKTVKYGLLGVAAPTLLAQKVFNTGNGIINGNDTITGTIKDFFGAGNGSGQKSGGKPSKQSERHTALRAIGSEYGRPELVPGFRHHMKLAKKSEIVAPTASTVGDEWGSFGRHYHDEGDAAWNRKVLNTERAMTRNSRNVTPRIIRKYKRILIDWLKERDYNYENYAKSL